MQSTGRAYASVIRREGEAGAVERRETDVGLSVNGERAAGKDDKVGSNKSAVFSAGLET